MSENQNTEDRHEDLGLTDVSANAPCDCEKCECGACAKADEEDCACCAHECSCCCDAGASGRKACDCEDDCGCGGGDCNCGHGPCASQPCACACGCGSDSDVHVCPVCGMVVKDGARCACTARCSHCDDGHESLEERMPSAPVAFALGALTGFDATMKVLAIRRALKLGEKAWILPLALINSVGILPAVFLKTHPEK